MRIRFDNIIREQTSVITGIVINHEQREYAQTTYSGGGAQIDQYGNRVGTAPVTSHTTHHHKQDIWYRDNNDDEHNLALHNVNFKIKGGHGIAVLRSNRTGAALRVANLKTRYFWDLALGNSKRGKIGKFLGKIGIRLKALVIAALAAAPFINLVAILILLVTFFSKRHFRGIHTRPTVYGMLYILSALSAFMPIADETADTRLMDSVIAEDTRFTVSGSTIRSVATMAWYVMKPFEQITGAGLSSREELDSELARVPASVSIIYKAAGTGEQQLVTSETVIYDRDERGFAWVTSFTFLAFLFMYLRSVSADRISRGVAEALDRRIRETINIKGVGDK